MVKCPIHQIEPCTKCKGVQSSLDDANDARRRREINRNYNVVMGQPEERTSIQPEEISNQVKKIKDAMNKKD